MNIAKHAHSDTKESRFKALGETNGEVRREVPVEALIGSHAYHNAKKHLDPTGNNLSIDGQSLHTQPKPKLELMMSQSLRTPTTNRFTLTQANPSKLLTDAFSHAPLTSNPQSTVAHSINTCQSLWLGKIQARARCGSLSVIHSLPHSFMIHCLVQSSFQALGIQKNCEKRYLLDINPCNGPIPLAERLLSPLKSRAYTSVAGPVIEECLFRELLLLPTLFIVSKLYGISIKELPSQYPKSYQGLICMNALLFGLAHASNSSKHAYAQATAITIDEICLSSSLAHTFVEQGLAGSIAAHITNNLFALIYKDVLHTLSLIPQLQEGSCVNTQPIVSLTCTLLILSGFAYSTFSPLLLKPFNEKIDHLKERE